MSEIAIRVEDLGKKFTIGRDRSGDLRTQFSQTLSRMFRKDRRSSSEFWALRDLNFEISKGDVVGIIGRNGAGKSTLLKILSRITAPTTGRFEIDGRVSSLLEVGTGFHPELTGRENIFLNGTILGMRRMEIKKKFDEIVAFSGVEKFIDTPVKHYSSGMKVRLAFSVAAHLEPEILIVDEVLAVGDAEFQKKCLGKMDDVSKKEGRTVLFVSHNMAAVEGLCKNGILLNAGTIVFRGSTDECIAEYLAKFGENALGSVWNKQVEEPDKALEISACQLEVRGESQSQELVVTTLLKSHTQHANAFIAYDVLHEDGTPLFQAIPTDEPFIATTGKAKTVTSSISLPSLIPGNYRLSVWVGPHYSETYDWQREILLFSIENSPMKGRTHPHSRRNGFLVPQSRVLQ